jgi:hypothetical protein
MTTELQFIVVPTESLSDAATVKLSVVVSPRLRGGDVLGDYPGSMLRWTRLVQQQGLTLELEAGSKRSRVDIDRDVLRPDLWEALFNEGTPVRAYRFDQELVDRANEGVASFSMRECASLVKSIYREASVDLALPDDGSRQRNDRGHRGTLAALVGPLAVHWRGDKEAGRVRQQHLLRLPESGELSKRLGRLGALTRTSDGPALPDDEGHFDQRATQQLGDASKNDIAEGCMAFHHMPTPDYADVPDGAPRDPAALPPKSNLTYDPDTVLDFHQALSALGNYPSLQRALGLVFDLELPRQTLDPAAFDAPRFLRVTRHGLNGDFAATTGSLRTAYWLADLGEAGWAFHTASRVGLARGLFGVAALDPRAFGIAQVDVDGGMHKLVALAESFNKDRRIGGQPALSPNAAVFDAGATLPSLRSGGLSLYADLRALTWLAGVNQSAADNRALEQGQTVDLYAENLTRGMRLDVWDDATGAWHSLHERSAQYQFFDRENQPLDARFDPREQGFAPALEEGWVESAVTRPAPGTPASEDHYYLHEAFARWAGWSLSAPRPDLALAADPTRGAPETEKEPDPPESPFKIKVEHRVRPGSLPALRFGRWYRLRGRWVNLAGLSACVPDAEHGVACLGNPAGEGLSRLFALPGIDRDGLQYRRFEPVASPQVVIDDTRAVTGPGSQLWRLVIRSDNRSPSHDAADIEAADAVAADISGARRHLLPPRTSVEMAERMGMFDDAAGKLMADAATWALIGARDGAPPPEPPDPLDTAPRAGELPRVLVSVAGKDCVFPLIEDAFLAELPYLPDAWARGVALRDLPGAPPASLARIDAATPSGPVAFETLIDPNPRPGSALLLSFGDGDWRALQGLRLALAEDAAGAASTTPPHWDAATRTLTIHLPKGARTVVPVSCYLLPGDLPLMGVWRWLQEEIARRAQESAPPVLAPGTAADRLAHILQRVVEGGHWMLSPPVLLELVHALRQPLGVPAFQPLAVGKRFSFRPPSSGPGALQTALTTAPLRPGRPGDPVKPGVPNSPGIAARRDPDELAALTGWRTPASTEAYLLGALRVHGASTGQVELLAEWSDPVDDPETTPTATGNERETRQSRVDRIDLPVLREGYLRAADATPPDIDVAPALQYDRPDLRHVGYYDPEHDQIAFVQPNDASLPGESTLVFDRIAAPRHVVGDTRHHRIRYRALAVSRDADCFEVPPAPVPANPGDPIPPLPPEERFSRESAPLEISIPASARPLAPDVAYVLPSFGWQRQTDTAVKRSVRFGGGLRVYLKRPWFSSGEGELLGVALWSGGALGQPQRDRYKPYFTQWGMDPVWQTGRLYGAPGTYDFPDRQFDAHAVSLDETGEIRVDVAGYPVAFDPERQLWYADLTLDAGYTYSPFVRLALVRYQPDALPDARVSRVVLADFAQLTAGRAVVVHPDPARARVLRVQVSGLTPSAPQPDQAVPTRVRVRVQERVPGMPEELGWRDAPQQAVDAAAFQRTVIDGQGPIKLLVGASGAAPGALALWEGSLCFPEPPEAGRFRLLIEEFEVLKGDSSPGDADRHAPRRLIFAETVLLGPALPGAS